MQLAFHSSTRALTPPPPLYPYLLNQFSPVEFQGDGMGVNGLGGLDATTNQIAAVAGQAAATTGTLLSTLGVSAIAGPIGVAVAGAAAIAIALASLFKGCGQTCIEATRIANQAEPLLLQNLNNYLTSPIHYASLQAAALNNFDLTWNALVQACNQQALAQAGQNCVADRQRGACKWKASASGWANGVYTPAGNAGSGDACWNWFVGYRDPIANDPTVVPDPVAGAGSTPTGATGDGGGGVSTSLSTSTFPSLNSTVPIAGVNVPLLGLIGGVILLIAAVKS